LCRLERPADRTKRGDRIAIAYHGFGEAQPGMQPPHRYRVVVDRQPANTEGQLELTGADGDDSIPF
jgi:hypothetical protein